MRSKLCEPFFLGDEHERSAAIGDESFLGFFYQADEPTVGQSDIRECLTRTDHHALLHKVRAAAV